MTKSQGANKIFLKQKNDMMKSRKQAHGVSFLETMRT